MVLSSNLRDWLRHPAIFSLEWAMVFGKISTWIVDRELIAWARAPQGPKVGLSWHGLTAVGIIHCENRVTVSAWKTWKEDKNLLLRAQWALSCFELSSLLKSFQCWAHLSETPEISKSRSIRDGGGDASSAFVAQRPTVKKSKNAILRAMFWMRLKCSLSLNGFIRLLTIRHDTVQQARYRNRLASSSESPDALCTLLAMKDTKWREIV